MLLMFIDNCLARYAGISLPIYHLFIFAIIDKATAIHKMQPHTSYQNFHFLSIYLVAFCFFIVFKRCYFNDNDLTNCFIVSMTQSIYFFTPLELTS